MARASPREHLQGWADTQPEFNSQGDGRAWSRSWAPVDALLAEPTRPLVFWDGLEARGSEVQRYEESGRHQDGEEIRVLHFPRGHTDGDVIAWFTGSNVGHMGDQFVTYGFPFIDLGSGSSVRELIKNRGEILKLIPADAQILVRSSG